MKKLTFLFGVVFGSAATLLITSSSIGWYWYVIAGLVCVLAWLIHGLYY